MDKEITQKGITYILVGKNVYRKKEHQFDKVFDYMPCQYCGKLISNCGFASRSHYEMHKRKGHIK